MSTVVTEMSNVFECDRPQSAEPSEILESIFRISPSGLLFIRLDDGKILKGNREFARSVGRTLGEIVGGDIQEYCRNSRMLAAVKQRLLDGETIKNIDLKLVGADGEERSVVVSAEPMVVDGEKCALFMGLDVTEQMNLRSAEQESRDIIEKYFHASPAPTIITRESDGRILEVNAACCQLTGRSREELTAHTTTSFGIWDDITDRIGLVRAVRRFGSLSDVEVDIPIADGEMRTLLFSIQRIQVEGVSCLLSVGQDITSRKREQEALARAKEHAEEIVRFRSGMLSNVTHEIRTPLTVILGFTSMLRQGVSEEYRRFVDLIERSGKRLLLTLDSVLDLAHLEAGTLEMNRQPCNMTDLVNGSLEAADMRARQNGTRLESKLNVSSAYVNVDLELFNRVLDHLVDNALKFTKDGTVTVQLDATDEEVILHVKDTGIGIGQDFLPNIFEAFKQESTGLERSHQGSGLGLTVSKRVVEHFGGTLSVVSEKDVGSTFTITLPRAGHSAGRLAA